MNKKKFIFFTVLILILVLLAIFFHKNKWSGTIINGRISKTESKISANYSKLNGSGYYGINLKKGIYIFDTSVETQSGTLKLEITDDKKGANIISNLTQRNKITIKKDMTVYLYIKAESHRGGYSVEWNKLSQ